VLLTVDLTSGLPIYLQVRDRIVDAIADGTLREGSRLPTTRDLAADLGVNFHTINKAYDLLRQEGLLRLTRQVGAVVQRDPDSGPPAPGFADGWDERLHTMLAEAVAQGMPRQEIVSRCQTILAALAESRSGHQQKRGTSRG
jgi:DNA-binding transcriptional regulator YhcF (GntR family)